MEVYNSTFAVEYKLDNSPVTIADQRSNDKITAVLSQTDIPILSEESVHADYSNRKSWTKFWLVDPLDGTKQFIKRNGEFTINVALVDTEGPLLGVLYLPVTRKLYYAIRGEGAFCCEAATSSVEETIAKSLKLQPEDKHLFRIAMNRTSAETSEMKKFIGKVQSSLAKKPEFFVSGSALKFGLLAEGSADFYPRFKPSMEWDTAAGHVIVNETGFAVVNADTGQELQYNKPSLVNPSFIVGRPEYL